MKILRIPQVLERVGYRRSTLYVLIREGRFPKPIALGPRAIGFVEEEVDAWIRARITESRVAA